MIPAISYGSAATSALPSSITCLVWNVNGIRAIKRKGNFEELFSYNADVIGLQEIKAEADQLTKSMREVDGYISTFHSSQERKGHSGTALYSKITPTKMFHGFAEGIDFSDMQARLNTIVFGDKLAVINVYTPNGGSKTSPLDFKKDFYTAFLQHVKLFEQACEIVIVMGDFNIAHTAIDLARPEANKNRIGFLPEERAILDRWHEAGLIDVFRHFNPDTTEAYTWWDQKTRARDRNVGWRIDYAFINRSSLSRVKRFEHLTNQMGSDHCPILISIDLS